MCLVFSLKNALYSLVVSGLTTAVKDLPYCWSRLPG